MISDKSEQFKNLNDRLKTELSKKDALNDLKNLLSGSPSNEIVELTRTTGLHYLLNCLYTVDKNIKELTCEVLELLFSKFPTGDLIKSYLGHIMFLLRHEDVNARKIAVDEVLKAATAGHHILPLSEYLDLYVAVCHMVTDKDVGIANKAIMVTSHLEPEAYPRVLDEMSIALQYDSTIKCNAYEVIINISTQSSELLNLSNNYGYIERILSDLDKNDVLFQMVLLELLSKLAVTSHGIRHLIENNAIGKFNEIACKRIGEVDDVVLCGYLKLYGSISHVYPEIFKKYPALFNCLANTVMDPPNEQTLIVAIDTFGIACATIEAKLTMAGMGSKFTKAVEKICTEATKGPSNVKIRALYCLASMIGYDKDPNLANYASIDNRVKLMSREWLNYLGKSPMDVVYGLCKYPFVDVKMAAFSLLDAVTQYDWGIDYVAKTPGFIEYLLDRSAEHTKSSKEAKYDIIKRIAPSQVFEDSISIRLNAYVDQGPFYKEAEMDVAMEED